MRLLLSCIFSLIMQQVAYSSGSIMLSNRQRFINFFRTYPSDESFVPAVTSFIQFYGWKRILFITQDQGLFTAVSTNARAHILCH